MLRHIGKNRTFSHNFKLSVLLSFIAGIVNISGVLSLQVLTTNVTGHFAFIAEEAYFRNFLSSFIFISYVLLFLAGAFTSNFIFEFLARKKPIIAHTIPMIIEIIILASVGFYGTYFIAHHAYGKEIIACLLLFSMGIQNSLVTKISNSTVRTTHLTGLFTDLGIELSQLFFYRKPEELFKLKRSIRLKAAIVFSFFTGCISGAIIYKSFGLQTLLLPAVLLMIGTYYDTLKMKVYLLIRKVSH